MLRRKCHGPGDLSSYERLSGLSLRANQRQELNVAADLDRFLPNFLVPERPGDIRRDFHLGAVVGSARTDQSRKRQRPDESEPRPSGSGPNTSTPIEYRG